MALYLILYPLASAQAPSTIEAAKPHVYSIALYYSPRCPYSKKVLDYLNQAHLSIPLKNVTIDPQAKEELKSVGGFLTVPCLIVDGNPIYEVSNIIDWLSTHQEELEKRFRL